MWNAYWQRILDRWCRMVHRHSLMHPTHGVYRCRRCLRTFPVEWEGKTSKPRADSPSGHVESAEVV
jgi:hypothetical protein